MKSMPRSLALIWLLSLVAGCQQSPDAGANAAAQKAGDAEPPAITMVKPQRRTLQRTVELPGTVQAFQETPLYAKIAGYVKTWNKDIGAAVNEGEILAELWVPEVVAALERKEALVKQADAGVEQARKTFAAAVAAVKSAEAQVKEAMSARQSARAEFERYKSRFNRLEGAGNVVDKDALDEARFRRDAAEAGVDIVEAKITSAEALRFESQAKRDKAEADITAALAHLEVTRADRDETRALLSYATIRAPFRGVVTKRSIDVGHFVQPAAAGASKGEPIFVVMQVDPVRVFVQVPENDAGLVQVGDPVRIRVQSLAGHVFEDKVTRTASSLDPDARTLLTEIDLPNAEHKLLPRNYVSASIKVSKKDVWTLPATAVIKQGENSFCYRVENARAVRTSVAVGLRDGPWLEITQIQAGGKGVADKDLTGQETVIENAASVTEGQAVHGTERR
jgi:HlyD family secretion protein